MLFPSHQNPDKNNLTQYKIRGQVLNLKANTEYEAIVSCNVAFGVTDEARIKILTDVPPPVISLTSLRSTYASIQWTILAQYRSFKVQLGADSRVYRGIF